MEATNQEGATTTAKGKKKGGESRPSSASLPFGGAAVIVGGGVAGTAAAAEICKLRPDARVTLVARDDKVKVNMFLLRGRRQEDGRERERKKRALNLDEKNPKKNRKTKQKVATNVVRHTKYIETFDSE